uniref:Putative head-tail connector n=1 Tax=viral metagenome TaxID=1070528 RepID=A0A6M3J8F7_9ZZZZ
MSLIVVSSATGEPVTVGELKAHLRLSSTDEDDYLSGLITVARIEAENYMKRQIMPATYKLTIDDFSGDTGVIELSRPPISTASSNLVITYVDEDSVTQTLSNTAYTVDTASWCPKVRPSYDNEWPTDVLDNPNSVSIQYVAGYPARDKVPEPIKHWIKMTAGALYEHREPIFESKSFNAIQYLAHNHYNGLLDPYMVIKV